MTRGRCSSLRLHRDGLAPSTFRRSPGAPVHTWHIATNLGEREAKKIFARLSSPKVKEMVAMIEATAPK